MTYLIRWATVLLALALTSCGGGGGVGSGGTGNLAGAVGSGGTGISVGPISGFGSIIVNGVEFDTNSASLTIADGAALQLGMTVEVAGTINAGLVTGMASSVVSAADLRGAISTVDSVAGTLGVLGTTVTTDNATIFDGVAALGNLVVGDRVQIYGLLESPGSIRATRIELLTVPPTPVLSGTISNLNPGATTFSLGTLTVNYGASAFVGTLTANQLANGLTVRVRATADPLGGVLLASQVQAWHPTTQSDGAVGSAAGVVTNYVSVGAFKVLGIAVDASTAQVTGGPASSVGNGVKVDVTGTMRNGVLVAEKLQIRHVPGTGGPVSFNLSGTVGAFVSSANFRVKGNPVDASAGSVVFVGGTAAGLANGVKVNVVGSQVVNGVLIAQTVTFTP